MTLGREMLLLVILVFLPLVSATEEGPDPHPCTLPTIYADSTPAPEPEPPDSSILWLARATLSETDRPHEQMLVAWVIRNRVETRWRGERTYKGVVLDPYQFSAFNKGMPYREEYITKTSGGSRWKTALQIAHTVYHAPPETRPFPITTRHFFSEVSMPGNRWPNWAHADHQQHVTYPVDERRFRFFTNIPPQEVPTS